MYSWFRYWFRSHVADLRVGGWNDSRLSRQFTGANIKVVLREGARDSLSPFIHNLTTCLIIDGPHRAWDIRSFWVPPKRFLEIHLGLVICEYVSKSLIN